MRKEYAFYLTDEQISSIRLVGVEPSEVSFSASGGMVTGTVMDEYEITCYTFRKNGEVVRETRGLDADGWVTDVYSVDGVWTYEVEVA